MSTEYDTDLENDSFEGFLKHTTSDRQSGYLKNWKKQGYIDTWMHTKRKPMPVWRHQLVKLVTREDKDSREMTTHVWSEQYVCHEEEHVLRRQHRRGPDGAREVPPEVCGLCKLIDWCASQVATGRMHPATPLFKFEGDDPRETLTIHAAGIYNGFAKMDSPEQKAELKRRGVFLNDAWKENAMAKASYIFCVVDNDDVDAGVQIATNPVSLGDKVKSVMLDRFESLGRERGNPAVHPYAIRWQYRDKEKEFNKKYHALPMDKLPLTDAIRALITGPAPDLTKMRTPFNQLAVAALLEKHCLVPNVPWEALFGAGQAPRDARTSTADAAAPAPAPVRAGTYTAAAATPAAVVETEAPVLDADGLELFACDHCGKPVKENWNRCPACDTRFEGEGLVDPPAPAPTPAAQRRRRMAQTPPAAAPPPARAAAAAAPPFAGAELDGRDDEADEDAIPF